MIIDLFRKNSAQQSASNNGLDERLNKHPQLKKHVETLLNLVENTEDNIEKMSLNKE